AALPFRDLLFQRLELSLDALAVEVDVVRRAVEHAPDEDDAQKCAARVFGPEPQRTRGHGQHRVYVLDAHECGLLQGFWERENKFSENGGRVGAAEPGEGGWAACFDFVAASNADHEVVG